MNIEILAVGTELLLGDILNTNAQFLSAELAALGLNVLHQSVVGDNAVRLAAAIKQAIQRSDMVITTGGLGPTGDDITSEVVSEVLGLKLVPDAKSIKHIQDFFNKNGLTMTENNLKQAMLPEGAIVFANDWGTAPGFAVEGNTKVIILLPGPPRENIPMFNTYVKPYISKYSDSIIYSDNLRVFGISESAVEEKLLDLMHGTNPTLAPYAKDGEVLLRITAKAKTKEEAQQLILPIKKELYARLGNRIYGKNVDSLQQVVVDDLKQKGLKIALAESCTGGLIAKRLTEISGSSQVFDCCVVSYSDAIKQSLLGVQRETLEKFGAVSSQTAAEMAEGARLTSGADIGVGITGIAGPTGGSTDKPVGLVYISISNGDICYVRRLMLGRGIKEREYIRYLASSNALDMVRRFINNLPQLKNTVNVLVPSHYNNLDKKDLGLLIFIESKIKMLKDKIMKIKIKDIKLKSMKIIKNIIPMKGDTKKQIISKIIFIVAVATFIISASQIIAYYADGYFANLEQQKITSAYTQTKPNSGKPLTTAGGVLVDFTKLLSINSDTKGYITIPNTQINYPVVQTSNNDYYLTHNFEKKKNRYGCPFIDMNNSINPMSKNVIIYGHNMKDDQMFADLLKFENLGFYKSAPVFTFNTIYQNTQWKIFAVFVVNTDPAQGDTFNYIIPNFSSNDDFMSFIKQVNRRSIINTNVDVLPNEKILTLSTCAYDFTQTQTVERFVVMARPLRPGESLYQNAAIKNPNPQMPELWYKVKGLTMPTFIDFISSSSSNRSVVTSRINTISSAVSSSKVSSSSKAIISSSGTSTSRISPASSSKSSIDSTVSTHSTPSSTPTESTISSSPSSSTDSTISTSSTSSTDSTSSTASTDSTAP
jgi:SrtB family sortase